jgi:hypothetical protein
MTSFTRLAAVEESHTRHKSAQMVAGYIGEADKWTKSISMASVFEPD